MKNSIYKVFIFLLICLINSSCDNVTKALKKNNPISYYTNHKIKEMRDDIATKVVDNKPLYDSLLLRKEKNDSFTVQEIEKMNDKVQYFLTITAKCDSIVMNCNCEKPYEELKDMFTPLYASMIDINQSFEQVSEKNKLEVKIAGEIMEENESQEEWAKTFFYDLQAMGISAVLVGQKVDVLVKEKEILEKLIQKQNASKANHQN